MMGGMGSFRKKSPAKERNIRENSVPGPIRRAMRCLTLASSYVYLYDVALFRRFPENKRRLYTIINIGTEKTRGRKESQYTDKIRRITFCFQIRVSKQNKKKGLESAISGPRNETLDRAIHWDSSPQEQQ